jgi:hypothetical protein
MKMNHIHFGKAILEPMKDLVFIPLQKSSYRKQTLQSSNQFNDYRLNDAHHQFVYSIADENPERQFYPSLESPIFTKQIDQRPSRS